jgi:hypothetical protein
MLDVTKQLADECDGLLIESMGQMVPGTMIVPDLLFNILCTWGLPLGQMCTARREFDMSDLSNSGQVKDCVRILAAELKNGLTQYVSLGAKLFLAEPKVSLHRVHFKLNVWAWVDYREFPYSRTVKILKELADRQGHDLCHHEPVAIEELMKLYGVEPPADLKLPARKDFKQGCSDYECRLYGPEPTISTDDLGPTPAD